jgi:competence protein ComEA
MDRIAEWRPVEPAGPDGSVDSGAAQPPPVEPGDDASTASRRLVGATVIGVAVVVCAVAGAIVLIVLGSTPRPAVSVDGQGSSPAASGVAASAGAGSSAATGEVIVDVEGAVNQSGLFRLVLGSRIGDAIAAAGGYSTQVDIDAATSRLNLAEVLVDGQQIHVPLRGEATSAPIAAAPDAPSAGSGLIDVNTATADELDTLPGIGPVTAAKIIAERQKAPFGSVDDLSQRQVVGASTLDKIRELITVSP